MKQQTQKTFVTFVVAGMLMMGSHATQAGMYAGIGYGYVDEGSEWWGGSATSFRAMLGYELNAIWAVELDYQKTGNLADPGYSEKPTFVTTAFVGKLPVSSSFSATAKVGVNYWDLNDKDYPGTGWGPVYGIGLQYDLSSSITLRYEHNEFMIADPDESQGQDWNDRSNMLNVLFRF